MLEALRKKLGLTEGTATAAATVVEAATQGEGLGVAADFAKLTADFEVLATAYTSLEAELTNAKAALDAANVIVAEVTQAKADAEAKALKTRMDARLTKLVDAIGEASAPAVLEATANLDDAAFEAVSLAMTGKAKAEAATSLFKEVGVDATSNATTTTGDDSAEAQILRKKYAGK
jgi:hypothetical protein